MAVAAPDSFRAVLDTSVLVRGILSSRGPSGYILESFLDGAFELVLSLSIIAEAESVLNRRHIRARPSFSAEDSHDLLVALEGGAGTIVTEDARDLLSLKVIKIRGFPPVQIVDAKAFARQLRQSR